MVSILTHKIVSQIIKREFQVPVAKTLIFVNNEGHTFPYYEKTDEPIVFPHAKKVIMTDNDRYFPDGWALRRVFPNADEIWISHVPKDFFCFNRDFPKFVTTPSVGYGYPNDKTMWVDQTEWRQEIFKHIPTDFFDENGKISKKYE